MMNKRNKIDTLKQACEYLEKVLGWKKFIDSHKPIGEAIEIVLEAAKETCDVKQNSNSVITLMQQWRWDVRFMRVAQEIATWSSCIRPERQVGAVIVKDKRVLTTGYNGAPSGIESCAEKKQCLRELTHVESGTRQEVCFAIHAEQNALLQAAKLGICVDGSTLYCTHQPCSICAKQIINAGIKRVVYLEGYPDAFALKLLHEANVRLDKFDTSIDSKGE